MLLEELVLGDLIREIGLEKSYKVGYYEGHRLWLIFYELRARDLQDTWRILDAAQGTEEYRNQIADWLQSSQPRRYPQRPEVTGEDWHRIKQQWESAGGKK